MQKRTKGISGKCVFDGIVLFVASVIHSHTRTNSSFAINSSGVNGWVMRLGINDGDWGGKWFESPQDYGYLVRPMLKN